MVEREESKFPGVTEPTHDWEVGREVMERTVAEGSQVALGGEAPRQRSAMGLP